VLAVTGAASAGGLTATANTHVTVSGTGDYKHGDKMLQLPASVGIPVNLSDGVSGQPEAGATGWKYARSIAIVAQPTARRSRTIASSACRSPTTARDRRGLRRYRSTRTSRP